MEPNAKRKAVENGGVASHAGKYMPTTAAENSTVYLDYNATTPLEKSVLDAIYSTLKYAWGNPSSCYAEGKMAKRVINESRLHVTQMIDSVPNDIIFTSGGTESNNMVFHSVIENFNEKFACMPSEGANENCEEKNYVAHVITTNIEHDSVISALRSLQIKQKIELSVLSVSKETGQVKAGDVTMALKWNTALVSIMLANNETGVIQVTSLFSCIL